LNVKRSKDEVWYWYGVMEQFETSGMRQKEYCDQYDVHYKKFCSMRYRIIYKRDTHPELYKKLLPIGRKYLESGAAASKFAKEHDVTMNLLSEVGTHIGYLDLIEEIKHEKEPAKMNFIKVPNPQSLPSHTVESPEPEIVEKQNDIEIIISKGVKVSISPNIDSMKIIKIIELLKDL
jgi:hypothetical protein